MHTIAYSCHHWNVSYILLSFFISFFKKILFHSMMQLRSIFSVFFEPSHPKMSDRVTVDFHLIKHHTIANQQQKSINSTSQQNKMIIRILHIVFLCTFEQMWWIFNIHFDVTILFTSLCSLYKLIAVRHQCLNLAVEINRSRRFHCKFCCILIIIAKIFCSTSI